MVPRSSELVDCPTVPFVRHLAEHGERTALVCDGTEITYRDLAERVAAVADRLGTTRRLVLVAGANAVDPIVAYLAALSAGHPVLLVPGDRPDALAATIEAYRPDVVVDGGRIEELADGTHDLHSDLALLLSTSGSTGSPKLVRLSHRNVQANAEAIADYLDIRDTDRAITTLPMHYCYGLSVLHSHLLRGAGTVLTDRSVTDPGFWDLVHRHRVSALAGVPYTFDLLDRVGFADMDLPNLRYVTQAGGRLDPDRVRRYVDLGRRDGWQFFVMYGQTEATARMAYLPPHLAAEHPGTIGVPVPGGAFRIDPVPEAGDGAGELVYTGPNVMLGYATDPSELALGRVVDELRTGDLAVRTDAGLYRIVGRRSRFAKLFGLRIDLQRIESVLARHELVACCAGGDDELIVAVQGADAAPVRAVAARASGLPESAVRVCVVAELPRTPNGKPDYRAVAALGAAPEPPQPAPEARAVDPRRLRALYADVLRRDDVTDDSTFVDLGGDSLSYVRMSVRLERLLGHLPADWPTTPLRELSPSSRRAPWGWRIVETNVLIRAVAIVLIVGSHLHLFALVGGAHVLLAAAGYNYARFQLPKPRAERLRTTLLSVARIAAPAVVWIGAVHALTGEYRWSSVFLLNGVLGPPAWTKEWRYWFIEALVYALVAVALLLAVPWFDRHERRFPFAFPLALVGVGLLTRYEVLGPDMPTSQILASYVVFWLFPLGWAAARATAVWQRLVVSVLAVATVPGFFHAETDRTALVIGGLLLLIWVPRTWWPALLVRPAEVLAASSLYIYLTHFTVYPLLRDIDPWLAFAASLVVGVAYWQLWVRLGRLWGHFGRVSVLTMLARVAPTGADVRRLLVRAAAGR